VITQVSTRYCNEEEYIWDVSYETMYCNAILRLDQYGLPVGDHVPKDSGRPYARLWGPYRNHWVLLCHSHACSRQSPTIAIWFLRSHLCLSISGKLIPPWTTFPQVSWYACALCRAPTSPHSPGFRIRGAESANAGSITSIYLYLFPPIYTFLGHATLNNAATRK
jgi:hypothetical protein